MPDIEKFKMILLGRKAELEARLNQVEADLDEPMSADSGERAIEMEDDEVLEAIGNTSQAELACVKAALTRIDKGTFGICVRCGEPISDARLAAVPHAALCRTCMTPG